MELRWNPTLAEWVIVSSRRRERPSLEEGSCPFCPGSPEVPDGNWEVLVLENRYPALTRDPPMPDEVAVPPYKVREPYGACMVVVLSPSHHLHFKDMPVSHIEKIVATWTRLTEDLSADPKIKAVFIFENRGREIGVTMEHPHGQVYAFPFIPPILRRELKASKRYFLSRGRCLFCDITRTEADSRSRMIHETEAFISFIPFAPTMPYGVSIYPKRHVADLLGLDRKEVREMSESIKQVVAKLDRLFEREMPYSMVFHQQPTDHSASDFYHLHIEFFPKYRERDKLKFLAGVELGAGTVTYDYSPEEKAAELRGVESG